MLLPGWSFIPAEFGKMWHCAFHTYNAWDKTIEVTGDTNIDYIKRAVALTLFKEILETYNMKQNIIIPTCKSTKIFNHLIANLPENKNITSNVLPCPIVSDHDVL